MRGRAALAWLLAALLIDLSTTNPAYRGLVFLIAANLALRLGASRRLLVTGTALAIGLAAVFNLLLSHNGTHRLASVPGWIPGAGGGLYLEAGLYGVAAGLGVAAALAAAAALGRMVDLPDLVDAFPAPLQRTAGLIAASSAFVPSLQRTAAAIVESDRLRGESRRGGLAVAVVLAAFEEAAGRAEAMEARAFGSARRTSYGGPGATAGGRWTLIAALAALAGWTAALALHQVGDWLPYPVAEPPSVGLLVLGVIALLTAPMFLWRSSSTA